MRARIAFLGSPEFAVPSLQAVAGHHDVVWVLTQPDRPAGRGRRAQPTPVRAAAEALGIEVETYVPRRRREIDARLRALRLDVLVVVAFGHILRASTLESARRGAVNVHASLLPRWRGVAPIERAIWAGDPETGVTLMAIDTGVDTGAMLARRVVPIEAHDNRLTLAGKLAQVGAELLASELGRFLDGTLQPVAQPSSGATYASKLAKEEGRIDWSQPAARLERQVRALYGWPGAWTTHRDKMLKIHAARVHEETAGDVAGRVVVADAKRGVQVACGTGRLELVEVQLEGRARSAGTTLVQGRHIALDERLGSEAAP